MPPQQPWQKAIIALAAVVIAFTITLALYWGRTIFIPVALAIFLSFVLAPIVTRLQHWRFPRVLAVVVTVVVALGAMGVTGWLVAGQMSALVRSLPDQTPRIKAKFEEARNNVFGQGDNRFANMVQQLGEVFDPPGGRGPLVEPVRVVVEPQGTSWMGQAQIYGAPLAEFLAQAAFTSILAVFILLRREDLRNRFLRLIGHGRVTVATKATDDASRRVSKYLLYQLIMNTVFGVIIMIGLFCMRVENALLWGFIAAVMRYVPYIGTWIGVIPPTLFSLALADGWWQPVGVLALFLTLEAISNNFVEPWIYGASLGVSEVAQLVSAGFWSFLWGPIGLILSQPLTTCVLVMGKYVPQLKFLDILLGDTPALEAKVAFYQRLAARDQDEATSIAEAERATKSADKVFDELFLPALAMARHDLEAGDMEAREVEGILRVARETAEEVAEKNTPADGSARVRVLGCPAKDEIDRFGLELFGHLLDANRWEYEVTAVATLTSELLAVVEKYAPSVVVVGSLPPGGLAHTKYLCKKLRTKFPQLKIVVGRWGGDEPTADGDKTLLANGADRVDPTLTGTRQDLEGWREVLVTHATPPEGFSAVGTTPALSAPV